MLSITERAGSGMRLKIQLLPSSLGWMGGSFTRAWPVGHRDNLLSELRAEEWLLIE